MSAPNFDDDKAIDLIIELKKYKSNVVINIIFFYV